MLLGLKGIEEWTRVLVLPRKTIMSYWLENGICNLKHSSKNISTKLKEYLVYILTICFNSQGCLIFQAILQDIVFLPDPLLTCQSEHSPTNHGLSSLSSLCHLFFLWYPQTYPLVTLTLLSLHLPNPRSHFLLRTASSSTQANSNWIVAMEWDWTKLWRSDPSSGNQSPLTKSHLLIATKWCVADHLDHMVTANISLGVYILD